MAGLALELGLRDLVLALVPAVTGPAWMVDLWLVQPTAGRFLHVWRVGEAASVQMSVERPLGGAR